MTLYVLVQLLAGLVVSIDSGKDNSSKQGSTAPSTPPGAEPFGRQGAAPAISGTFQISSERGQPPDF